MRCFSLAQEVDYSFIALIFDILTDYKAFFCVHNHAEWEEAQHATLLNVLKNYVGDREDYGAVRNYVLAVGKNILRGKRTALDISMMEDCLVDADSALENAEEEIAYNQELDTKYKDVLELAITYPEHFLELCDSIITSGRTKRKFPQRFKELSLLLIKKDKNFTANCMDVYDRYADTLLEYSEYVQDTEGTGFKELDTKMIATSVSKRVSLVTQSKPAIRLAGSMVSASVDLDREEFTVKGNLVQDIVKYKYSHILKDLMFEYTKDSVSPYKCEIADVVAYRTLAGSFIALGTKLTEVLTLCKQELLTNLLLASKGKYLGEGSDCFYILMPKVYTDTGYSFTALGGKQIELVPEVYKTGREVA